jgi:hypothetical protein
MKTAVLVVMIVVAVAVQMRQEGMGMESQSVDLKELLGKVKEISSKLTEEEFFEGGNSGQANPGLSDLPSGNI